MPFGSSDGSSDGSTDGSIDRSTDALPPRLGAIGWWAMWLVVGAVGFVIVGSVVLWMILRAAGVAHGPP